MACRLVRCSSTGQGVAVAGRGVAAAGRGVAAAG